jgi:dolichyl-phosphate-mannose-protein mannosyltransferase
VARVQDTRPVLHLPSSTTTHGPVWTRTDTIALVAITTFAGILRLIRVTTPSNLVFDEGYYAIDACGLVFGNGPPCHASGLLADTPVHPPLGEWLIAIGIRIFGFRSGGWRLASLAAGVLTVALLFLLAKALTRSTVAAAVASGLLAIDFLHFVHSRFAMLDIFVPFFAVAAFLFVVYDRRGNDDVVPSPTGPKWVRRLSRRRWRLAAGAALGGVVASKWSGIPFLLVVPAMTLAWELGRRSWMVGRERWADTLREEGPSFGVAYVVVPLAVYVLSYAGRIQGALLAAPWSRGSWVREFLAAQRHMVAFHLSLDQPHLYASSPWSWPFLKRPIVYSFRPRGLQYEVVVALGSPLVWGAALAALVYIAVRWVRRHRDSGESVILAGFAAGWCMWLVLGPVRQTTFLYYLLPSVPFMCLALGYVAARVVPRGIGRAAVAAFAAGAIALFAFFYPVIAGVPLDQDDWRARLLFTDCELNGLTLSDIELPPGSTPATDVPGPYPEALLRRTPPPNGWCWI